MELYCHTWDVKCRAILRYWLQCYQQQISHRDTRSFVSPAVDTPVQCDSSNEPAVCFGSHPIQRPALLSSGTITTLSGSADANAVLPYPSFEGIAAQVTEFASNTALAKPRGVSDRTRARCSVGDNRCILLPSIGATRRGFGMTNPFPPQRHVFLV